MMAKILVYHFTKPLNLFASAIHLSQHTQGDLENLVLHGALDKLLIQRAEAVRLCGLLVWASGAFAATAKPVAKLHEMIDFLSTSPSALLEAPLLHTSSQSRSWCSAAVGN